jgi:hypothetical protein
MHGIEKECRQNQSNVLERKRKRDLQLDNERAEETSLSVDSIALEKFAGISVLPSQSAYTLGSSVTYSSEAAFQPQTTKQLFLWLQILKISHRILRSLEGFHQQLFTNR